GRSVGRQWTRLFQANVFGTFVLSETLKGGMPEFSALGHLGEGHLCEQLRLHPVDPPRLCPTGRWIEGRLVLNELREARFDLLQRAFTEAGPDFSGVLELTSLVVEPDQKRAEAPARARRIRIAADHKLLPLHTLALEPGVTPRARIGR